MNFEDHAEHSLTIPCPIWEGRGCVNGLPDRLKEAGVFKFAVVIDPNVAKSDWGGKCLAKLGGNKREFFEWRNCPENAPSDVVSELADHLDIYKPEAVVAIGGGSTLDIAKAAIAVANSGATISQIISGHKITSKLTPIFAVPTTCGTGSEGSPFAVILLEKDQNKRGFSSNKIVPKEVFLDPDALDSLPSHLVASTGIDAMSHALETYISRKSTIFSRCASLGAFLTAFSALPKAARGDKDAKAALLSASFSSRLLTPSIGLTVAHAITHPLGAITGLNHGLLVSKTILSACRFNKEISHRSFARLAIHLRLDHPFNEDDSLTEYFFDSLEELIQSLPLEGVQIRLDAEEIEGVASKAMESSNIGSNPATIDLRGMVELVRECVK